VNDHILSVEETLGNTGKRITEINDEEGIQTKMHPTTMKEEPVLNADGTPKKDGIFKKLGCPMGDCRAHKKG
jgi:hypothetical protein